MSENSGSFHQTQLQTSHYCMNKLWCCSRELRGRSAGWLPASWLVLSLTKSLFTSYQNSIFLSQQSVGTAFFSPAEQALNLKHAIKMAKTRDRTWSATPTTLELEENNSCPVCSVGWFVSFLVRLCEREVLLADLLEQCPCKGAGQPS